MKSYPELLNIGFNNVVFKERVVAIVGADAAPIKRLKDQARGENRLVDATNGKKTRSIIITTSNYIILSALAPETLALRVESNSGWKKKR